MGAHRQNPFARGADKDLPPEVRDGYGRALAVGDEVICPAVHAPRLRVMAIKPQLDPRVLPNHMQITLSFAVVMNVPKGIPLSDLLLVRTVEELLATDSQAAAAVAGEEQPPAASDQPPGQPMIVSTEKE